MNSLQTYVQKGRFLLRRWAIDPRLQILAQCVAYSLAGFLLSAASLGNFAMPIAMGFVCACSGWQTLLAAFGGCVGFRIFWENSYQQPIVWLILAAAVTVLLADRRSAGQTPLLIPTCAALIVSAAGLIFQVYFGDTTPIPIYLLRTALSCSTTITVL